ncbi:hypothetical protein [Chryseobacterium aureum]|uniref:hypothetical protein n=1 Tax=Chryseobacterium aureum TaxID=2497456 RepID=UPI000F89D03B|nr:hypothetical protein [Chryseobacterium aureum]
MSFTGFLMCNPGSQREISRPKEQLFLVKFSTNFSFFKSVTLAAGTYVPKVQYAAWAGSAKVIVLLITPDTI